MFKNVGKKIKFFAIILLELIMLASIVAPIILGVEEDLFEDVEGILAVIGMMVGGIISAFITFYPIYGYGIIVQSHEKMLGENSAKE